MAYVHAGKLGDYLGRYELVDGKSAKFWECLHDGDNKGCYATRWGKITAKNTRNQTKTGLSAWEASDKIREKLNKGYRLVEKSPKDFMQSRLSNEEKNHLQASTVAIVVEEAAETPLPVARPRRL